MKGSITCKQAVDYISKKEEGKLSQWQRFALWKHLAACSLCRIFSAQNRVIRNAVKKETGRNLTESEKETIIQKLNDPE